MGSYFAHCTSSGTRSVGGWTISRIHSVLNWYDNYIYAADISLSLSLSLCALYLSVESANVEQRALWGSVAMATAVLGDTVASLVVSLLKAFLTTEEMRDWGWRLPFLSSLIVAILGIVYQCKMPPSREYELATREHQLPGNPVKNALMRHWRMIILMMMAVVPWCAGSCSALHCL